MVEASPVKFYFAKYFLLAFGILQWVVSLTIFVAYPVTPKNFLGSLVFFTTGLISFFLFFLVNDKFRRVAVGKNKIVVIEGDRNVRFEWPEVKSLTIVPYFNVYKLKIRGKKPIYFFPSHNIDPAFGLISKDTSRMGEVVDKRKKEFGIK